MALVTKNFSDIITFTRTGTSGTFFNSAGVLVNAGANEARFDYNPSTLEARGLLIEEARTNLKTFSESILTTNSYGASATVTLTSTAAQTPIQGLTTATKFAMNAGANTGNSTDGFTFGSLVTLAASTAHTQSIIVKADGASVVRLRSNVSGQLYDIPIAGPAPAPTGAVTASSVQQLSNGWARVSWSFTTEASGVPGTRSDYWTIKTNVADGSAGYLVTAAQLEAGAFPTSYIPTTTIALTRNRDEASVNTLSPWFNATEGTIFCQGLAPPGLANFPSIGPALSDGTANNAIIQYVFTNGYYSGARVGGVSQGNTSITTTPTIGSQYKFATAYSNNDSQSALNGTASTVDNTYTVPTVDQMRINTNGTVSGNLPNSWIQRITYYPRRLSQAELTAITA